eukprot:11369297-Karenia_brevis.AAC.1
MVQSALQIPLDCVLQDRRPPPKFAEANLIVLPYCDNLAVAAHSAAAADEARELHKANCTTLGFTVHEEEKAAQWAVSLGFALDTISGSYSVTPERCFKIRLAFRWLSTRPRVTGQEVERLLGHGTF